MGEVTAHGFPVMPYPSACPPFPTPGLSADAAAKKLAIDSEKV